MFSWLSNFTSGPLLLLAKLALAGLQAYNSFALWQAKQAGKDAQLAADNAATAASVKTGDEIVIAVEAMSDEQLNEAFSK